MPATLAVVALAAVVSPLATMARPSAGPTETVATARGELRARDTLRLRCEIEGETRLLSIVPEGTEVRAGDLLCEFDVSQLLDRRIQQKLAAEAAEATLRDAQAREGDQARLGESAVARGEVRLALAKADLEKHRKGDHPQQKRALEAQASLAAEELRRAGEHREWTARLVEQGFLKRVEQESADLALERARIADEAAGERLRVYVTYEQPAREARLRAEAEDSERELDRLRREGATALAQAQGVVRTQRSALVAAGERLAKLDQQIALARLVAPRDGVVVHVPPVPTGPAGATRARALAPGVTVAYGQELVELPDPRAWVADVRLPESLAVQVRRGDRARVRLDASASLSLEAVVTAIAATVESDPESSEPDARRVRARLEIAAPFPNLRPGMPCSAGFLVSGDCDASR